MSRNMAGPDGWRVPCFGLCMSPNEQDEVRVWAARLDKPVARAIRELVLAEARRAAQHPALVVEISSDGQTANVSSMSEPGKWHTISAAGRCNCPAGHHGRLCKHVTALHEALARSGA